MGKIRIKTLGDEKQEEQQRKKLKERREHKKTRLAEEPRRTVKAPGLKGGERVVSVGPSVDELEKASLQPPEPAVAETLRRGDGKKAKFKKKKTKGKRYTTNASLVDNKNVYSLDRALDILKKFKKSHFDETVELHINVKEKGVSGKLTLPHGTGKTLRIKIADDALIPEIEKGKIDFDVLVATPQMMPKLARVAKILGPRGLMPNPKAGTISDKPEETVEKLSHGQASFKTESAAPIIHMSVGKVSFEEKKLAENVQSVLDAIGVQKITSVTLKSTMSPGIKLQLNTV